MIRFMWQHTYLGFMVFFTNLADLELIWHW